MTIVYILCRDTMEQERVSIDKLHEIITEKVSMIIIKKNINNHDEKFSLYFLIALCTGCSLSL